MRTNVLVVSLCLFAACGGGGDSSSSSQSQTPACGAEEPDGVCDPATNEFGDTLVCFKGACTPESYLCAADGSCTPAVNGAGETIACIDGLCQATWEGQCSPEVPKGTCYDPAFPMPFIPAQFVETCCSGQCTAAVEIARGKVCDQ